MHSIPVDALMLTTSVLIALVCALFVPRAGAGGRKLALPAAAMASLALSGCGPVTTNPISKATAASEVPVDGMPGYALRSLVLDRGSSSTHFVYILTRNGEPVAGAGTSYRVGKSDTLNLNTFVEPSAQNLQCSSVVECQLALEEMKKQEQLSQMRTCVSIEDCAAKLEAMSAKPGMRNDKSD